MDGQGRPAGCFILGCVATCARWRSCARTWLGRCALSVDLAAEQVAHGQIWGLLRAASRAAVRAEAPPLVSSLLLLLLPRLTLPPGAKGRWVRAARRAAYVLSRRRSLPPGWSISSRGSQARLLVPDLATPLLSM